MQQEVKFVFILLLFPASFSEYSVIYILICKIIPILHCIII